MNASKPEAAFGLTEVLVALLLITVMLAGTLAMHLSVIRASGSARDTSSAAVLAQSRLEEFRAVPFAQLAAMSNEQSCFDHHAQPAVSCSDNPAFTRTTTVVSPAPSGTGFAITVQVQWQSGDHTQQITMGMERHP